MGAGSGEVTRELPNVEDLCNNRQVGDTYVHDSDELWHNMYINESRMYIR